MSREANTGKGRILVVDDEMLNRTLLSTNLQESGYTVETAGDGQQALQLLRAGEFDAVLLDLIMPGVDGFQVLDEMRHDPHLGQVPVVLVTATSYAEDALAQRGGRQVSLFRTDGLSPAEVLRCLRAGRSESEIMPLDENLSIMRTMDEIRAQVGVSYPAD